MEGGCARGPAAGRPAGQKDYFRSRGSLGGVHHAEGRERLRPHDAFEIDECPGKNLSIVVQGVRMNFVMRMLDLGREARRLRRFMMVPVVHMRVALMRQRMQHRNPGREEIREQGDGDDEDSPERARVGNAHGESS